MKEAGDLLTQLARRETRRGVRLLPGWHFATPSGQIVHLPDTKGRLPGLARVASALDSAAGLVETGLFRVDGNQFAVGLATRRQAKAVAEHGRAAVERLAIPLQHPELKMDSTVTVSAAVLPGGDVSSLEKRATDAIREAKRLGRNRVYEAR